MRQKWEYTSTSLKWNRENKQWESPSTPTRPELIGARALYEYYGENGWELVTVLVQRYEAEREDTRSAGRIGGPASFGDLSTTFVTEWGVSSYQFYFKQPREE